MLVDSYLTMFFAIVVYTIFSTNLVKLKKFDQHETLCDTLFGTEGVGDKAYLARLGSPLK